jgi:signal transduction histidine kinase
MLLRKQQTLTLGIPEASLFVNADAPRVKQILHNLISNASKFSPTGCEIQLRAQKVDRSSRWEGPGLRRKDIRS